MPEALQISDQKRKLLESYLQLRVDQAPVASIPRRGPGVTVPLTFSQQQLWLHAQLSPGTPVYNEPFTVHRSGPLDVEILEKSFTELVRRHEAWRTTFPVVDGQPTQIVHPAFAVKLPVADLRAFAPSEREAEALRLATEDARKPFDLSQGPLFRARLIRLDEEEFRLAITAHHMIFDGVTGYRIFLPELVALYNAFSRDENPALPALDFQYADYAVWQRHSAERGQLAEGLEYWRKQLAGELPTLQLPTDRPRPAGQTFRGALQSFALPATLSTALRDLSREEGVTLFMTLLAAFDTLLHRYSGQEDILVGSITAGRNFPGTEKLLGFFLNTVVLRTNLSGDPTFRELLERARNVTLGALSHDEVPLDELVKQLHPGRDLSSNPLFQVLLSFEPALSEVDDGWDLTAIDVETGTAKFDLCFVLDDRAEGLQGRVIYSTDLFETETIICMIEHWQTLLESVVADPSCRISKLGILTGKEREQLLAQSAGPRLSPLPALVHELIATQAQQRPEAIAVSCGDHSLSYGELDRRSNQLACHLATLGVKREIPVALCVERSLEMIVGILGVLKAGGAYVPLDTNLPIERLEYMLADCGAAVLLTQAHLPPLERVPNGLRVIRLDSDWNVVEREPADPPDVKVIPDDLAYLIYTSGSTGRPKGVMVTHDNLAHSTQSRIQYYQAPVGKYLLLSPIGFDSSVAVIFHALCTGGTLVLPEPEFNWEPKELAELILRGQVSHTLCVPSLYRELLEAAAPGQLETFRTVIVAGEACPKQLVELHYRQLPEASLFNEYGPTETTVWSSVHACDPADPYSTIPIGRPIANTSAYVLDRHLQPSPLGVPGELHVGGEGVARGYWRQPELTKERFILNPFAAKTGSRFYKTGDLVRWLADGNIEFLGRVDDQIKIRGLRIELSEIETALGEHPDVSETVVAAEEGDATGPRLVAYVVARREYSTSAAELRAFLKSRLPAYMVPAAFSFVAAIPRTPNGKVDRRSLALSEIESDPIPAAPSTPRDFVEARLLAIWKDVLERDDLDIRQDFFELGGHSLLAAKLLARIEADFGQTLSLAFVFQAPTIELMAELLRNPDESIRARAIIPVQPQGSRPPLFWVRGGPRFRLLAQKLGPDQPFLGLDLPFSDATKFRTPYRLEEIASYLVRAMREVQPHGPYSLAGLCVNAVIAYEIARQLSLEGEEVALLAMFDGHNHAYYTNPLQDGRYTGRIKYHLSNLFRTDVRESSAYLLDRLDEARRKIERTIWQLSATNARNGNGDRPHNTDFIVHPAFHRYEPLPYSGRVTLLQSSDWPEGPYFDFKLGWMDLAAGGVEFHRIPGDHPSMFTEPNVNLVASMLSSHLDAVRVRQAAGPSPQPRQESAQHQTS
jgi:surfactin family lipopeptide synthetase A